jgi:hypothetical protein
MRVTEMPIDARKKNTPIAIIKIPKKDVKKTLSLNKIMPCQRNAIPPTPKVKI